MGFIQQKAGSGTGTTVTITLDSTPLPGSTLFAVTNGNIVTISGGGVTWTLELGGIGKPSLWVGLNSSGSGTSIVFAMIGRGGSALAANVSEFSGVNTSNALDVTATSEGTASTLTSGTTATTIQADELLIAFWGRTGGNYSSGPTNEFTRLTPSNYTTTLYIEGGYKIVTAVGAYESSINIDIERSYTAGIATYKYTVDAPGISGTLIPGVGKTEITAQVLGR